MKTCKNPECKKEFEAERNRQTYCTTKCRHRAGYLKFKKSGKSSYYIKGDMEKRECASRICKNTFETTNNNKSYCSNGCAKREIAKRERETKVKVEMEKVCQSRNCSVSFKTIKPNAKYCSRFCGRQENNRVTVDRARAKNPPSIKYNKVVKERERRFAIPKFSAEWLQVLWDNKRGLNVV